MLDKLNTIRKNLTLKELGVFLGKKNAQGFPVRYDEWGEEVNVPALADYDWSVVSNPITRKELKTWIADLRSGRYEQGQGQLRVEQDDETGKTCSFCCLGVLAETKDLLDDEGVYKDHMIIYLAVTNPNYDRKADYPEHSIFYEYLPYTLQSDLAGMNDLGKKSFKDIANHLEKIFAL